MDENTHDSTNELNKLYQKITTTNAFNPGEHDANSRLEITKLFLWWFFSLIAGAFLFSAAYNFIAAYINTYLIVNETYRIEYLNVVSTVSIITTTLSGSVGFVIGFYFKNKLDKE